MRIIRKRAYARAGLLGNPSDGYNGKTISIIVRNYWAEVVVYEWDSLEIVLAQNDRARFHSIQDLARDVELHGYYGGIRLIKATIKRFYEYCRDCNIALHDRNFSVRYSSTIPQQVGMAGSSGIIVATMRGLMEFYDVEIPLQAQPTFVLSVETEELGIAAGLQDRVIQCYEGIVYMDFDKACEQTVSGLTCYAYEQLGTAWLPSFYVAFHTDLSEPTERFHNDIRGRYNRGDAQVVGAMRSFAELAAQGLEAIRRQDAASLNQLIDSNFDLRRSIYKLPSWQSEMVDLARSCGASAKFAGSGGAIIGLYHGESMLADLRQKLEPKGCKVIVPQIDPLS